jgi:hypothetical protein
VSRHDAAIAQDAMAARLIAIPAAMVACIELVNRGIVSGRGLGAMLAGIAIAAAFGIYAARRPGESLVILALAVVLTPAIDHPSDFTALVGSGSMAAWAIGAPAGWLARTMAGSKAASITGADRPADSTDEALKEQEDGR